MPLVFEVKVVPSSGKSMCTLDKNNMLKCYLKSPAQKGKANKELIKMLSKALKVPQADLSIVSGLIARLKRVRVERDVTFEQLLVLLGIDKQMSLF